MRDKEKLVYRSQFQPAPSKKSLHIDGGPSAAPRRRSPPRNSKQLLRLLSLALAFILLVRMVFGWFGLETICLGHGRKQHQPEMPMPKPSKEWRQGYEDLQLGLKELPDSIKLPSGDHIPSVGLGTWQASRGDVGNAVKAALEAGYRHLDCAWIYGNEAEIGEALQEVSDKYPRESLFITSKLWNTFHAPKDIEPHLNETLTRLKTSYLDLLLIHWPVAQDAEGHVIETLTENPYPTWKKLEELVAKGKIRNIGVSNFNIRRLTNLTSANISIRPAVNQVELNYWNPQPELVKWSKENNIVLEAYSPLGGAGMVEAALNLPIIQKISKKLNITPAQVLISWHVQRGTVVLPKSVHAGRISEDYQLFTLPTDLFEELETAATSHPPRRISDPSKRWGLDIFEDDIEKKV